MTVGDVNSTERGSGARFNDGKPPLELIPLRVLADALHEDDQSPDRQATRAIRRLGYWQEGSVEKGEQGNASALRIVNAWDDCSRVFDYGRKKYAEWNWVKGMAWSVPLGCAARHLRKWSLGEELDPESGLSHAGHAMCNIVMLVLFERTFPEGDDRPPALLFVPPRRPTPNLRT